MDGQHLHDAFGQRPILDPSVDIELVCREGNWWQRREESRSSSVDTAGKSFEMQRSETDGDALFADAMRWRRSIQRWLVVRF